MQLEELLKLTGKNIARLRKERSLTQREAAKRAEISYRYFQHIEAGKVNMTLSTLTRLAEFLKVHVCEVLPCEPVNPFILDSVIT